MLRSVPLMFDNGESVYSCYMNSDHIVLLLPADRFNIINGTRVPPGAKTFVSLSDKSIAFSPIELPVFVAQFA